MGVRWSLIKKKVGILLEDAGIHSAPVPIEDCARQLKATIRFQPLEGSVSGMVHRATDGRAIIGINSLHPENRKRFSIAHEIGHLMLHAENDLHIDAVKPSLIALRDENSSLGIDDKEVEANQFAAELLMPEEFIKKDFGEIDSEELDAEEIIDKLATSYKVSVQSMTIKLNKLGLIK